MILDVAPRLRTLLDEAELEHQRAVLPLLSSICIRAPASERLGCNDNPTRRLIRLGDIYLSAPGKAVIAGDEGRESGRRAQVAQPLRNAYLGPRRGIFSTPMASSAVVDDCGLPNGRDATGAGQLLRVGSSCDNQGIRDFGRPNR